MFEREIKFIHDFSVNKIKKLGSYFTLNQLQNSDIHPAILKYINSEIEFLIFEDRQQLLKNSAFDYSGDKIAELFSQISSEIMFTKRLSAEYVNKLMLHAISFNVNYLVRPKWALSKFLFDKDEHKTVIEVKQILNYVYFYDYLQKILLSYLNQKKLLSLNQSDLNDLLIKIDKLGKETYQGSIIYSSINSMAEFLNIGAVSKDQVHLEGLITFLKEKEFTNHISALQTAFQNSGKQKINVEEIFRVINSVDDSIQGNLPNPQDFVKEEYVEEKVVEPEPITDIFEEEPEEQAEHYETSLQEPVYQVSPEAADQLNAALNEFDNVTNGVSEPEEELPEINEDTQENDIPDETPPGEQEIQQITDDGVIEQEEVLADESISETIENNPDDFFAEEENEEKMTDLFEEIEDNVPVVGEEIDEEPEIEIPEIENISVDENRKLEAFFEDEEIEDEEFESPLSNDEGPEMDFEFDANALEEEPDIEKIDEVIAEEEEGVFIPEGEQDFVPESLSGADAYQFETESIEVEDEQVDNITDEVLELDEENSGKAFADVFDELIEDDEDLNLNKEHKVENSDDDILDSDFSEKTENTLDTNSLDDVMFGEIPDELEEGPVETISEVISSNDDELNEINEQTALQDLPESERIVDSFVAEEKTNDDFPDDLDSDDPFVEVEEEKEEVDEFLKIEDEPEDVILDEEPFNPDVNETLEEEIIPEQESVQEDINIPPDNDAKSMGNTFTDEEDDIVVETEEAVVFEPETEIENVSAFSPSEPRIEISDVLEHKNMTKIIEVIFDYDMEDFANTIESISEAASIEEANEICDRIFTRNKINPKSKEADSFRSIISEYFGN